MEMLASEMEHSFVSNSYTRVECKTKQRKVQLQSTLITLSLRFSNISNSSLLYNPKYKLKLTACVQFSSIIITKERKSEIDNFNLSDKYQYRTQDAKIHRNNRIVVGDIPDYLNRTTSIRCWCL